MKRSWQALLVVVVVGLVAGAAIAGRPELPDNDVRIRAGQPADSAEASSPTEASTEASTEGPVDVPAQDSAAVSPAVSTTTAPGTSESTSTTGTSTIGTSTIGTLGSTTTVGDEPDRTTVRLIVANATGRSGVATETADRLRAIGYTQVSATDARNPRGDTAVFTRAGFESHATQVAADLGLGSERVQPLPDTGVTNSDANGDIVVVVAPDLSE